ncbi:MAG: undecaprenyldiphospho-muramoylpentapeptide beta-N-acetylglucosaminyltransferase [Acidobacteriia bacterium]|nr:undecaprenyldiphospho-muramoylpentapeptide beta-N-acetylglucosaminyltransferase [Terriglobia bacterium]
MRESIIISGVDVQDKQPQRDVRSRAGRRTVAVAGGGTAGHVNSALAIMSAYQSACGAEVYFIGCQGGFETQLVPASGFDLVIIPGTPYARQSVLGKIRSLLTLVQGTLAARRLLKRKQTNLVIGVGGYASLGSILAARILGIPCVIHEANVFPGLANRLIGSLSARVFVGWSQASAFFSSSKTVVTGNPVRPVIAARARDLPDQEAPPGYRRILVTGGSLGSPFLNQKGPELLARVRERGVPIAVRHQSGEGEAERLKVEYQRLGIPARVSPFIDDMAEAYREADFAIATAGALTLAELATFGLPALLIPLQAAAADHQMANAKAYAEHAGTSWVEEHNWDPEELAKLVATTLADSDALSAQARRLREMARPDAARTLVEECEAYLTSR